jgi:hypothetical protein
MTAVSDEAVPRQALRPVGPVRYWSFVVFMVIQLVVGVGNLVLLFGRTASIPTASQITVPPLDRAPFVSARYPIGSTATHRAGGLGLLGAVYPDTVAGGQSMTLAGVPFTFIVPSGWQCVATTGVGATAAYGCMATGGGPKLTLFVRHCPMACAMVDRAILERPAPPPALTTLDAYTQFGEPSVDGRYAMIIVDVFTVSVAEPLQWLVLAKADGAPADIAAVQRVVNDIYNQTRV